MIEIFLKSWYLVTAETHREFLVTANDHLINCIFNDFQAQSSCFRSDCIYQCFLS